MNFLRIRIRNPEVNALNLLLSVPRDAGHVRHVQQGAQGEARPHEDQVRLQFSFHISFFL